MSISLSLFFSAAFFEPVHDSDPFRFQMRISRFVAVRNEDKAVRIALFTCQMRAIQFTFAEVFDLAVGDHHMSRIV